jgi:hypothetical protein
LDQGTAAALYQFVSELVSVPNMVSEPNQAIVFKAVKQIDQLLRYISLADKQVSVCSVTID